MKENINNNISNNSNVDLNNNTINKYKECPYCNIILNPSEYNDHILCHELDREENGQLNNINNYQIGNCNNNNNSNNNEDNSSDSEDGDIGSKIHNFFGKISDKAKSIINPINDNKEEIKNHLEKIPNFFKNLFDKKEENKKENEHQNIPNNNNNRNNLNNRNSNNLNSNNRNSLNNRNSNNLNSNNRNSLNNRNSYLNQRLLNRIDRLNNRNNFERIRNYPRYNYNRYRRRLNHDNENIDDLLLLFEQEDNNNNSKNNLFKEEDAKEILRYIPNSIVKEIKQPNDNNYKCTICLSEFQIGELESTLPCLHMYHTECIEKWIIRNRWCPVCKYDISLDSILAKNNVEVNNNN